MLDIPPPPEPPYDVETLEPLDPPPQWHRPEIEAPEPVPAELTARLPLEWPSADPVWHPQEIPLDDGRVLVLDGDPVPPEAPAD